MNEGTSNWISMGTGAGTRGAPLLRREFSLDGPVAQADLRICGLGYHEAWINQQRVGDHVLDPAQTDYERRVFYVSHDVSQHVRPGLNCIGVMLGNGWYNQDRVWGEHGLPYGPPCLLLELRITLADGRTVLVTSDASWKCAPGPITDNNIYAGECYDARLEQAGWNEPGFDDRYWEVAVVGPGPSGRLEEQKMPPIRKMEELRPIGIHPVSEGKYLVDMGQNFAGWVRIRVTANTGREIQMRFAETVDEHGQLDTASTGVFATKVEQVDRYICKGGGEEQWEPRFTYHGFRYVELSGWPGELAAEHLTGLVVHTDLPVAGAFACSDDRLNQLHRMAVWTHRSNIHGLPEDCPARERCGWLGDANLVAEYSMWNYAGRAFWEKFLGDIETACTGNHGIPTNIAPGKRGTGGNANPDWAAAFIMLPWYLYLFYGDKGVLALHWEGMQRLMQHYKGSAEQWILRGGYGDYFDPGSESIVTHTSPTLSTTLWFYRCACVMAAVAEVLQQPDTVNQYRQWSEQIAAAVRDTFFDQTHGSLGSQGANTLALAFGVLPDEEARILKALVVDILKHDSHLNVGIMGVRYLFEELTRRGHGDLALAVLRQDSYPSFGNLIQRGATTLWECWGEKEHDRIHGARSLNHPFMGGYDNWFYNTLAGIRPDPANAGFRHYYLVPHPVTGLDWVRAHYDCPYGRIVSSWRFSSEIFTWQTVVPQGSQATATLPFTGQILPLDPGAYEIVVNVSDRTSSCRRLSRSPELGESANRCNS